MKPIDMRFEIPCKDGSAEFKLVLENGACFFGVADFVREFSIKFLDEQLDSLENCFYAMYMLIRNSKD